MSGLNEAGVPTTALFLHTSATEAYVEDGNFSNQLDDVYEGSLDFGDVDRDGDLDLLLTGRTSTSPSAAPVTKIYLNNGNGFTNGAGSVINLTGVYRGDAKLVDFDHDGDLDVAYFGLNSVGGDIFVMEKYDAVAGTFSLFGVLPSGLASGISDGEMDWGDYNNDGYQDLLISGTVNNNEFSRLYRNQGDGLFDQVSVAGLDDYESSTLAWADFNADGFLDFAVSGSTGPNQFKAKILRNNQAGGFVDLNLTMTPITEGQLAWADYNNDGHKDLLMVGSDGANREVGLYTYLPNFNTFLKESLATQGLPAVDEGAALAWGDYDRDGKIDMAILGEADTGRVFSIIQNIDPNPSTAPLAPTGLSYAIDGYEVLLQWKSPLGDPDSMGYSYNIVAGYTSGGTNIDPPEAITSTGRRQVAKRGFTNDSTTYRLSGLNDGTIFWRVQAINADFEGSPFSSEFSFPFENPAFLDGRDKFFSSFTGGLQNGDLAFGDYDNDGDPDLLISGDNGTNAFTRILTLGTNGYSSPGLTLSGSDLSDADVYWIDVDGDNDLDAMVTGIRSNNTRAATIYLNNNGNFSSSINPFTGVNNGSIDWADFDNDGDADLLLTGDTGNGLITRVYLNEGGNTFTQAGLNLPGVKNGTARWVDFNRDGFFDIFLTGETTASSIANLYRNNGNGTITFATSVPGLKDASADFGDFNNDGFPDLAISGQSSSQILTRIYPNVAGLGFGTFIPLTGLLDGDVIWGDYDNDGNQDLMTAGYTGTEALSQLYRNDGAGGFETKTIASLPFVDARGSSLAWGDPDGNGKLDLAILGQVNGQPGFGFYYNVTTAADATPSTPGVPTATFSGDTITISWNPPTDAAAGGYSYNLMVGTASNGTDVASPMADLNNGYRKVVYNGNVGYRTVKQLIGLPSDTYHFKVQAVNQDFQGSGFASGIPLAYAAPNLVQSNLFAFDGNAPQGFSDASLTWGDYDNDGDLDFFVMGKLETEAPAARLYRNNNGVFAYDSVRSIPLQNVWNGDASFGDFNEDGWLDLAICGQPNLSNSYQTRIYTNTGFGNFAVNGAASDSITNVLGGDLDWGDYDQDGDLDLIVIGQLSNGNSATRIYENQEGTFVYDPVSESLTGVRNGEVAWGDFNADGFLDIALAGLNGSSPITRIYRSNGLRGGFTDMGSSAPIPGLNHATLAWADIDGDQDLDLAVGGDRTASSFQPYTAVWRYDAPAGSFSLQSTSVPQIREGAVRWADVNDDSYPDLFITGKNGPQQGDRMSAFYLNNGSNPYNPVLDKATSEHLTDINTGSTGEFGDYDQDGKIDLLIVGQANDAFPRRFTGLYRNVNPASNLTPPVPTIVNSSQSADSVVLEWNVASYAGVEKSLAYNLYLFNTTTGQDAGAVMAELPSGSRKVVARGLASTQQKYVLRGLQAGKYYWSVQAIEQDFEGGTFAPRDSFIYDPPIFVDVNSIVFDQTPPGLTESAVYWVDYDQDQDLDIALAGDNGSAGLTAVYENVDGTYFVRDAANSNTLENVRGASMSWEDINLDGFPDVVIAGNNGNPFIRVYLNDGNGNLSFSAEAQALSQNLAAVEKGSLDFADFDNDGDPDLLVSGQSLNGSFAEVYKNDRGQALIPLALNLSIGGEGKWADYDRDGLMDFVLSGTDSGTPKTSLFHNEGDDTFAQIDAAQSQLPDLTSARLDWGDADNDGFLDLALSGLNTGGNPEAAVYLNDGTGVFSSSFTFTDAARGDIAFGDYNDDHLMDVVLTGEDNGSRIVRVEKNTGNGTFSTDAKATNNLAATSDFGAIAWGDYNGDQKLDLLVSGETSGAISSVFTVYRNDDLNPNNTIEAPSDLTAEIVAADVKLSWNAPTNVAQPFLGGLTYNLVIGTMEGEGNTKPALAQTLGPKSGLREVARLGNIGQVRSWILDGDSLRKGETYFWGVQAIGVDFEGSPFNLTGKFTFNPPAFEDVTGLVFPGGVPLGIDESVIILGDYDDDGDLDIFSAGQVSDVAGSSSFFLNQSNSTNAGRFDADVPNTNAVLPLRNAAADWGDYDGDGDLDLVVSGLTDDDLVITRVYNNQDATFVWDEEASGDLRQVQLGSLKWGDYNNDGDLDLLLTGEDAAATLWTVLYDNEDGRFTPLVLPVISGSLQEEEFEGVKRGTAIWGDYDADGFLDIAVTGLASTGSYTRIFSNLGSNRFREKVNFNLSQLQNSDADFGDFDNDGDLDLLISGDNSTQTTFRPLTVSYIYDRANDNFVENAVAAFEHVTEGNVRWGDFNDDGQPDVLISGKSDETPEIVRTTRLYRNEGDSTFSEDLFSSAILEDVNLGSSSWGDFNGNGKLDVFLTGRDTAENRVFAVYRNIDTTQNKTPGVPTDLDEAIDGAGMRLSWDPPLNHPQDLELGLAYNVYVRKVGQPDFELSPQSDINDGYRKIVQLGNAQGGTSWTIYGLEDGQYEWSVQATDQDFEGSIFANPRTFDYVTPVPDIIETFFPERWTLGGNNVESYIRIRDTSLVAQTTVRYRAISDSVWQTSSSLPLAVDTFSYFLGEGEMRYIGLEYFYEVEGKFGFDIRSDTGRTFIYHPDGLIFGSLKFGKTEQDYNLLAFPLRLENTAISDLVEDDFGTYNPYQWRFWHYDNGALSEYTEGLTSVEDGKGYWLITKKQNSFRTSPGTTVEVWADRPYKISLKQGYNQVGNPYDFNVAWEDILRHNLRRDTAFDQKVDPMFTYDRAYQNTPSIPKREGAFFFAAEAVEMEIPVFFNDQVNRTAAYRPSLQAEGDISSPHWRLPIWLESGNTAFQIGGIGMDENASPGKDPFDRILPPRLSQYLDMHVYHEEFFAPHFSWDVVPAAKFHVWEVMVETNLPSEEIMLRWDPSFFDLSGMKLYLLDVEHQQLLDMSEQGHFLSISQQAKRPFRIYFGSESNIFSAVQPDKIHLGRAYPNPSSGPITIPFALPNSGHRYELQFSLLDMSGRRVMDLGAGDWQGGFHELRWDGKNQEGIPLPPGVYIYQMIVTGSGQKATLYSRLIIK
ncbi:MAG: FG-GAP-like repeat-containing protein [Bacteroidota bacterium]